MALHITGDTAAIAHVDPDEFLEAFRQTPAVHRFPGSMATRVQTLCQELGKQYGFTDEGWREASAPNGEEDSFRSVADIVSPESLSKVREHKKAMKAANAPTTSGSA
ncbi:MAG: hypothetical protein QM630_09470 [Microbacterium sp.]